MSAESSTVSSWTTEILYTGTTSRVIKATTSTAVPNACDSSTDPTCNILMVIVCFVLSLAIVMCIARILFVYCAYKRRGQNPSAPETYGRSRPNDVEEIGHPFSYLAEQGLDNCGFTEPPPRYDQLFKRDEPPPTYDERGRVQTDRPSTSRADTQRNENVHVERSASTASTARPPIYEEQPHTSTQSAPVDTMHHIASSSGNLPMGAFGTSVPPHVLAAMQDDDFMRSRTSTVESISGFLPNSAGDDVTSIAGWPPTRDDATTVVGVIPIQSDVTTSGVVPISSARSDDVTSLAGSQYYDASEQPSGI